MIKGKIVLVPFPFDDLVASKVRPAVCLTNRIGHHHHVDTGVDRGPDVTVVVARDLVDGLPVGNGKPIKAQLVLEHMMHRFDRSGLSPMPLQQFRR